MACGQNFAQSCHYEHQEEVSLFGDGKARLLLSKEKVCNNGTRRFVSLVFKGICSLIRYWTELTRWGILWRRIQFLSIVCSLSPSVFAGCGNRQRSGHCCSEIAFTDQSTRAGCIQPKEPGPLCCRIVHRDGQYTLSLVWT